MRKKWLINVSEEPDMINATLDIGRSLKQIIIGVSFFFAFQGDWYIDLFLISSHHSNKLSGP